MIETTVTKRCICCGKVKDVDDFYLARGGTIRNVCKDCRNEQIQRAKNARIEREKQIANNQYKRCPHCYKLLPMSEFYLDSKSKDGHSSWCKSCRKLHDINRRLRKELKSYEKL